MREELRKSKEAIDSRLFFDMRTLRKRINTKLSKLKWLICKRDMLVVIFVLQRNIKCSEDQTQESLGDKATNNENAWNYEV